MIWDLVIRYLERRRVRLRAEIFRDRDAERRRLIRLLQATYDIAHDCPHVTAGGFCEHCARFVALAEEYVDQDVTDYVLDQGPDQQVR